MGWKIVRDKNEAWCRAHGVSGTWRVSPDPVGALGKKLLEEVSEYLETRDPAELYDVADVLNRLLVLVDPDANHLQAHFAKTDLMGNFSTLTEWTPVPPEYLAEAVS